MTKPKIVTSHVYPPVPVRNFDWAAWRDGEEERGRYGYGTTEAEAIADLLEMEADDE
jgi:hypothetical protein